MSTFAVHPRITSPTSMSRGRPFVLAIAVAVVLTLVIAGVSAAIHGSSASALPQHRDMAPPTRVVRDTKTHTMMWVVSGDAHRGAASTPAQSLRARHPGK